MTGDRPTNRLKIKPSSITKPCMSSAHTRAVAVQWFGFQNGAAQIQKAFGSLTSLGKLLPMMRLETEGFATPPIEKCPAICVSVSGFARHFKINATVCRQRRRQVYHGFLPLSCVYLFPATMAAAPPNMRGYSVEAVSFLRRPLSASKTCHHSAAARDSAYTRARPPRWGELSTVAVQWRARTGLGTHT